MAVSFFRPRRTAAPRAPRRRRFWPLAGLVLALALPACASTALQAPPEEPAVPAPPPQARVEPALEPAPEPAPAPAAKPAPSGKSYVAKGKRYHILATAKGYEEKGLGTFYSNRFQGQRTSSGEKYDVDKLTAAHKTLPLGSEVEVRNLENDRTVIVRINDRGPFSDDYVIDVSRAAARKLGMRQSVRVSLKGLGK